MKNQTLDYEVLTVGKAKQLLSRNILDVIKLQGLREELDYLDEEVRIALQEKNHEYVEILNSCIGDTKDQIAKLTPKMRLPDLILLDRVDGILIEGERDMVGIRLK